MKAKILLLASLCLTACGILPSQQAARPAAVVKGGQTGRMPDFSGSRAGADHMPLVWAAEQQASGKVKGLLTQARVMALMRKEIVRGSCWDYLDTLYNRAGVPRHARKTVHRGSFAYGPFADPNRLQVGDWIYHVNHNYRNNEHSGMFIGWVDKERRLGLTLSYAGEGRKDPARYKVYDLSSIYNIMRAE